MHTLTAVLKVAVVLDEVVPGQVRHGVALPVEAVLQGHTRRKEVVAVPRSSIVLSLQGRDSGGSPPGAAVDGGSAQGTCFARARGGGGIILRCIYIYFFFTLKMESVCHSCTVCRSFMLGVGDAVQHTHAGEARCL